MTKKIRRKVNQNLLTTQTVRQLTDKVFRLVGGQSVLQWMATPILKIYNQLTGTL
jgi:hypothetical protein